MHSDRTVVYDSIITDESIARAPSSAAALAASVAHAPSVDIVAPTTDSTLVNSKSVVGDLTPAKHVASTGGATASTLSAGTGTQSNNVKYDLFLSHLQRNGQDAIISMQVFLQQARPGIKIFIDLDVDMKGDLTGTLEEGVKACGAFLFFITDGILTSEWCAQELRWAAKHEKKLVLVRETDERHGGLDMNAFLKQVPDDLMHVFKNNIAIPWYRQPAFRSVSIQSILKAADLHDELEQHLQRLEEEREAQFAIKREESKTCFDIISAHSWALSVVFFFGGFTRFRSKLADRIYTIVFTVSFWACGILCTANLVFQSVPYHVIGTDVLTAYVHLPAWQSWLTWRSFVTSPACDELVVKVRAVESNRTMIARACRFLGWVVIVLQMAMVVIVLGGFSLPRTLGLGGEPGKDWGNDHAGVEVFTSLHAYAMWAIIPPVIAAMFASYSMFAFIAGLHWLDIRSVKKTLEECVGILGSYYGSSAYSSEMSASSKSAADGEALFQTASDLLANLFRQTQGRIDKSCQRIGALWVHLVFFSTCQVLAISLAFALHAADEVNFKYRWWWGLQDFFHLGGGVVLLAAAMGVFCIVTTSFHFVLLDTLELLGHSGCPAPRQASMISLLAARPLGMHIMSRSVYIDASKAGIFFFVITAILINNCIRVLNGLDT